jgi:hypothetical protein
VGDKKRHLGLGYADVGDTFRVNIQIFFFLTNLRMTRISSFPNGSSTKPLAGFFDVYRQ